MANEKKRVLFLVTEDWFFAVHFLDRAIALRAAGYEVAVAARVEAHGPRLEAAGLRVFPYLLARRGKHPIEEARSVASILRIYRDFAPHLVHHIAMKPILYGTFAARRCGVPVVVNELTGMGYIFTSQDLVRRLARQPLWYAYRAALGSGHTIVQNRDDRDLLLRKRIVAANRLAVVYGAGVDTESFIPTPEPAGAPLVVLPARMLEDKGVPEFVQAARTLKARGVRARFALVGMPDPANPASIPERRLEAWVAAGDVEWWGWRADMHAVYAEANVVCLPSHREGLPRSLIEAAACGRAIVTTNVPGCREAVIDGENGLLVPARDPDRLAEALEKVITDPSKRSAMAARGRDLAVSRFSVRQVVGDLLAIYGDGLEGVGAATALLPSREPAK